MGGTKPLDFHVDPSKVDGFSGCCLVYKAKSTPHKFGASMDFKMVHVKFMSFLVVWNDKAVDDWNVVLPTMKEVVGSKGALFHEEWHTDGISDDFRKQATGAGGSFDVVFSDKKPEKTTIRNVPTKPGFNEAVKVAYRDRLLRELRRAAPDPNAKTKPR